MTKVEFVVIGFPKCGTTSLVDNLNKHSKINCYYDTGSKESVFFHSDYFYNNETREKYEKYLVEGKINGEKNPTYIWNYFSLMNIQKYNPDMKLIICLRNPVDYIYSWYHQLFVNHKCKNNDENEKKDEEQNKLQEDEKKDEALDKPLDKPLDEMQEETDWDDLLKELGEESEDLEDSEDSEVPEEPEKPEQPEQPEESLEKSESNSNEKEKNKNFSFYDFYSSEQQKSKSYFINYISSVFELFPKENIRYVIQEEYEQDNQTELNKIFKFLGVEKETLDGMKKVKGKRPNGDMDEKTRKFLEHRYKIHNKKLFKIINRNIDIWNINVL